MIKKEMKRDLFGPINGDFINLSGDNVEYYEVTFHPSSFHDNDDGYYHSEGEYMSLFLRDINCYLHISLAIDYSYSIDYCPGDYFTPASSEICDEDLDVWIEDGVWMEDTNMNNIPTDFDVTTFYPRLISFVEDYIECNF